MGRFRRLPAVVAAARTAAGGHVRLTRFQIGRKCFCGAQSSWYRIDMQSLR
jgi:hypothetical protein